VESDEQGQSAVAWSIIGARADVPAAHRDGIGTGEALNEHVTTAW
jgi:hypothetical protein